MRSTFRAYAICFAYVSIAFLLLLIEDPGHVIITPQDLPAAVECNTRWPNTDAIAHCNQAFVRREGRLFPWAPGLCAATLALTVACAAFAYYSKPFEKPTELTST